MEKDNFLGISIIAVVAIVAIVSLFTGLGHSAKLSSTSSDSLVGDARYSLSYDSSKVTSTKPSATISCSCRTKYGTCGAITDCTNGKSCEDCCTVQHSYVSTCN